MSFRRWLAVFYGAPPGGHADKAEDRGKDDPITRHRLPREVRIGDPEQGEHQHHEIRPLPHHDVEWAQGYSDEAVTA